MDRLGDSITFMGTAAADIVARSRGITADDAAGRRAGIPGLCQLLGRLAEHRE